METLQAKRPPRVPHFRSPLGRAEARAVAEALASGWVGTGVYGRLFEARFAAFAGARRCAATNSGTAALHLALEAAGARGGEVVTSPLTDVGTVQAILHAGARPVFADVEPERGTLDPAAAEAALTPRTRAILAVHLHGHPADLAPLRALARRNGAALVEDCCQAVGGAYHGRPLGSVGDAGCFSFGRFKNPTTVDGGAVVFKDPAWEKPLARMRRLGHEAEGTGFAGSPSGVRAAGWHCRMNDLAAALGLCQLSRWPETRRRLERTARLYREALAGHPSLRLSEASPGSVPGASHFAVRAAGGRGGLLARFLRARGIDTEAWLYPVHLYRLCAPFRRRLPVAERLYKDYAYLPFSPGLSASETERVAEAVRRFRGRP
ncbi:MAG: aminotransferase class V-fold PLP-dependent enzyme [Elusimicrobia bacterium]|nr:aminotransferase class V-fold PLP-dependent enzyme [Elusimicrobiota bacterium]